MSVAFALWFVKFILTVWWDKRTHMVVSCGVWAGVVALSQSGCVVVFGWGGWSQNGRVYLSSSMDLF